MQPRSLLHEGFDQVVVVAEAHLVLVEGSLLANDQVVLVLPQLRGQRVVRVRHG